VRTRRMPRKCDDPCTRPFEGAARPYSRRSATPSSLKPPRRALPRNRPRGRRHAPLPEHRGLPRRPADPARRTRTLRLGRASAVLHGHALPPRLRRDTHQPLRGDEEAERALRPLLQRSLRTSRPRLRRPVRRARGRGRGALLRGLPLRRRQSSGRRTLRRRRGLAVDVVRLRRARSRLGRAGARLRSASRASSQDGRRPRSRARLREPWRRDSRPSRRQRPRGRRPRRSRAPAPRP
jgi:hypothetical protein